MKFWIACRVPWPARSSCASLPNRNCRLPRWISAIHPRCSSSPRGATFYSIGNFAVADGKRCLNRCRMACGYRKPRRSNCSVAASIHRCAIPRRWRHSRSRPTRDRRTAVPRHSGIKRTLDFIDLQFRSIVPKKLILVGAGDGAGPEGCPRRGDGLGRPLVEHGPG